MKSLQQHLTVKIPGVIFFIIRESNIVTKGLVRKFHASGQHLILKLWTEKITEKIEKFLKYDDQKNYIPNTDLIINTTPLGTFPNKEDCPPIDFEYISKKSYCYDLIYNPVKTRFLIESEKLGASIKNGLEMLENQAEESWRIWNS